MPQSRRNGTNESAVDDYPVRPNAIVQNDVILRARLQSQKRTLITFSLIYFFYGTGIALYGLLYPKLAKENGFSPWMCALVLASSHFMSILLYPLSCRFAAQVSTRNSLSVSIFVIGSCRMLFGTINLIPQQVSFIALSYAIPIVEGIGMSIFVASTVIVIGNFRFDQMWKISLTIQVSLCLGLAVGPPVGQILTDVLGFSVPFYIIGGLTILSFIVTATVLKEPEQRVAFTDIPIVYWMSDKRMLIYFFITLETFIYVGFLSISLSAILKKFHLKNLYMTFLFSLASFIYGLTMYGWKWLIKKGFNNVMLAFLGSVVVIVSLILIGPAPFTSLVPSLPYVCSALVLEGLGIACKCTCVLDAAEKDLRSQKKHTEIQQKLIVPTIVMLGALSGYFWGLVIAGIMDSYLGYKKATLALFALEIATAVGVVILAMNRNYISKSRRDITSENAPILNS